MQYLMWEIDWYIVQRMLIDAYKTIDEDNDEKNFEKELNFNEQTADELTEMFSKHLL